MADIPPGEGYWKASDGNWYPPEQAPAPPAPPPPGPPGTIPAGPVVSGGPIGGGSGGGSRNAVVIAVAVVVLLIAGVAVFALAGGGGGEGDDDATPEVTRPEASVLEPDTTEEEEPDTTEEEPDTTEEEEPDTTEDEEPDFEDASCTYAGLDSFDDMQAELVFTNPLDDVSSIVVTFALLDGDDVRFITSNQYIDAPQPGEEFRIGGDTTEELPSSVDEDEITCAVLDIEEGFDDELTPPGDEAACEFLEIDSADDIQIELTVENLFEETSDLLVAYALRGPDGVRFATGNDYEEVVAPGEVVRFAADTVTELPDWVDEEDFACEVLSIEAA